MNAALTRTHARPVHKCNTKRNIESLFGINWIKVFEYEWMILSNIPRCIAIKNERLLSSYNY